MFSIIIPTYNGENKIEQTLNKLLHQCISSTDEIEIIVINDGSTDLTKEKLEFYTKYNQIKVVHQKNKGVSAARNMGISLVSKHSKYITFIDDSDSISDNFFTVAKSFFYNHPDIEMASIPIFSKKNCIQLNHVNRKKSRRNFYIFDITNQHKDLQYHIGGVIFKKNLFIKEKYSFDENINYWEDAKLINTILLDKRRYGLILNAKYFYDREDKESLSHIAWRYHYRYTPQITNNYIPLIIKSKNKYGKVLDYIQNLIITHYLGFIYEQNQELLVSKFVFEDYIFKDKSNDLLSYINTQIIDELNIPNRYKAFLYYIKGENFSHDLYYADINVYFHQYSLLKRRLKFSFSHEAFGLSKNSVIYRRKFNGKLVKAQTLSGRTSKVIGKDVFGFSLSKFEMNFSIIRMLFGTVLYVFDSKTNKTIKVKSISIIKRIFLNYIKNNK
jgi:glycosyltransferase involved in cell wall biosynthesis